MSLNKTLDRLFAEIRREAKRNRDFANRLDAALRLHDSRRDVPAAIVAEIAASRTSPPGPTEGRPEAKPRDDPGPRAAPPERRKQAAAPLNPVGLFKREGEAALAATLASQDVDALRALVAEHNLDPSGATAELDHSGLAAHVLAQAQRRAERDEKLFDY